MSACRPVFECNLNSLCWETEHTDHLTKKTPHKTQHQGVFFVPPHPHPHPHTHTLSAMWFVFPYHICMWPLIGKQSAALRILAVDDGQQHHDNHEEHQRGNCLKPERMRSHLITLSQTLCIFFPLTLHIWSLWWVFFLIKMCLFTVFKCQSISTVRVSLVCLKWQTQVSKLVFNGLGKHKSQSWDIKSLYIYIAICMCG